jgi:cytidylate kinase
VLADVRARDARDAGRAAAPMQVAPDAMVLDTSLMSVEDAVGAAIAAIDRQR